MLSSLLILPVISSKLFYEILDFRDPGFNFSELDELEEEIQKSVECPGVNNVIKSYRYPILEDGVIVNKTIKSFGVITDYLKEEVFLQKNKNEPPSFLGERVIQPHLNCKSQEDPDLVNIVKEQYLDPPSVLPYNFKFWNLPVADGQSMMLDHRYFQETVKGGFFIEAGAHNGETDSTTLYLELRHKWSGLLVEPLMREYKELRGLNRRAWSSNTCLSPSKNPTTVQFTTENSSEMTGSGIVEGEVRDNSTINIQCLPLSTLILALGNPRVDFLSLDIEGAEFDILKTVLWDKIDIRAISVETMFASEFDKSAIEFNSFLEARGFQFLDKISRDSVYVQVPRPDLLVPRRNLATQSRRVGGRELLTRTHYPFPYRICQMFHVPKENLAKHCRMNFPLDYFRDIDVAKLPRCMTEKQCAADFSALLNTYRYILVPWKTLLSDGCTINMSDRYRNNEDFEHLGVRCYA